MSSAGKLGVLTTSSIREIYPLKFTHSNVYMTLNQTVHYHHCS